VQSEALDLFVRSDGLRRTRQSRYGDFLSGGDALRREVVHAVVWGRDQETNTIVKSAKYARDTESKTTWERFRAAPKTKKASHLCETFPFPGGD
jgi:hypothetical protein